MKFSQETPRHRCVSGLNSTSRFILFVQTAELNTYDNLMSEDYSRNTVAWMCSASKPHHPTYWICSIHSIHSICPTPRAGWGLPFRGGSHSMSHHVFTSRVEQIEQTENEGKSITTSRWMCFSTKPDDSVHSMHLIFCSKFHLLYLWVSCNSPGGTYPFRAGIH